MSADVMHAIAKGYPEIRARAVAMAVLALSLIGALPGQAQDADTAAAQSLRVLEQQVALSGGKDFYLVLEPSRSQLTLYLKGAMLQQFRVEELEVGRRRWAFVSRGSEGEWAGVVWRAATLEPERVVPRLELVPGSEPTAPPPLPEEHITVPPEYRIRFEDGLALEVHANRSESAEGWSYVPRTFSRWWTDFREAVWSRQGTGVRLRLTLSDSDADSLYRALPPNTSLLIVPPGVDLSRSPAPTPRRSRS